MARSAERLDVHVGQFPVPVSMTGTRAFSTQPRRGRARAPRGTRTSTRPTSPNSSSASPWPGDSAGKGKQRHAAARTPPESVSAHHNRRTGTRGQRASRKIQAFPDLRQRLAASEVTFGAGPRKPWPPRRGTMSFSTCRPLDRRDPATTRPRGSGWAATPSRPAAMDSRRSGVRESRWIGLPQYRPHARRPRPPVCRKNGPLRLGADPGRRRQGRIALIGRPKPETTGRVLRASMAFSRASPM